MLSPSALRWLVLFLVFTGEALTICTTIMGAHQYGVMHEHFWSVFLKLFPLFIAAGALFLSGFILGFSAFKDIWIVNAISIISILLVEPTISFILFHQSPGKGAAIGLLFGLCGLASVLFL